MSEAVRTIPEGRTIVSAFLGGGEEPEAVDSRTVSPRRYLRATSETEAVQALSYKIKWPHMKRSIYMHVTYVEDENDNQIPFEVFFNGGDSEVQDMLNVIGRQTSSIFQRGGDVRYVVKDFLKEVSAATAFLKPPGFSKPIRVDSLAAYIGYHLLDAFYQMEFPGLEEMGIYQHFGIRQLMEDTGMIDPIPAAEEEATTTRKGGPCSKCGEPESVFIKDGCPTCMACGDSKCG